MLVGDAACFIDPVLSSGVHLSTYSALLAARSINTCLSGAVDEARCMDEFERRYLREYLAFYDFLVGFYDMAHDESSYFWQARKVLHTKEHDAHAFVRLVAGGGTTAPDFMQWSGVKRDFFEDYVTSLSINEDPEQFFRRYADKEFDAKAVTHHLRRERGAILEQAQLGEARDNEALFDGGLVPSRDGFHWSASPPGANASAAPSF
jgi:halogenation protein CepH